MMCNLASNLSIFIYLNDFVPNEDVGNEMKRNGSPTSRTTNVEERISRPAADHSRINQRCGFFIHARESIYGT